MKRALTLALIALALCGCILQSRQPLFDDSQSELALGGKTGMTRTASYRKGQWEDEKEQMPIAVEGKHYVMRDKTELTLHFVHLGGIRYAMQAREADGPAAYLLAEVKNGIAEVRTLACSDLQKDGFRGQAIDYQGDDCFIRPGTGAKELFTTLFDTAGDASFRLEIVH